MTKTEKHLFWRIIAAGSIFAAELMLLRFVSLPQNFPDGWVLAAYALPFVLVGVDCILRALRNIIRGQIFDENFLMVLATVCAFALGEYTEGVAVMLFYQVGELFQSRAVSRSRRSIADLMNIRPDTASVLRDGILVTVSPEEVTAGERIAVRPGERIPLDGFVEEGVSSLDTAALTGESIPREVGLGDEALSGCVNLTGLLTIRVSKPYGQSTVAKIMELVENASDKKSRSENFITRFARIYTPAVVLAAILLALVPPLAVNQPFSLWAERALTLLVISCPCALVISVPLSFFGGIGGAAKKGILVKGGNVLEALACTELVVFDKTGTLTMGRFAVSGIQPVNMTEQELLRIAAHAEAYSNHPIAVSLREAYGKPIDPSLAGEIEELTGFGVRAFVAGQEVLAGNARLMERREIPFEAAESAGTVVYLAVNNLFAGKILIEDKIKPDAHSAIDALRDAGVKRTCMLTGDSDAAGRRVADSLGLDEVYTQLLPANKVEQLEILLSQKREGTALAYVGDGINDAPVLARADAGIAMGGVGSDAAIEAADVVIMTDEPIKVASAIKIGRKTMLIARQNIIFSLAVKTAVLVLGAFGLTTMWAAVFADVGVSVAAILNAIRTLRT